MLVGERLTVGPTLRETEADELPGEDQVGVGLAGEATQIPAFEEEPFGLREPPSDDRPGALDVRHPPTQAGSADANRGLVGDREGAVQQPL